MLLLTLLANLRFCTGRVARASREGVQSRPPGLQAFLRVEMHGEIAGGHDASDADGGDEDGSDEDGGDEDGGGSSRG